MTLPATASTWLLFLHVLAAATWVGASMLIGVLVTMVIRGGDAREVARFTAQLRRIGPLVLMPATLATVGFGVWLVAESSAWDFDQTWVRIAIGLFAVAFLIGAGHQSVMAIRAERAAKDGRDGDALRFLRRWALGYGVIVVVLIVALWDMTNKPGM